MGLLFSSMNSALTGAIAHVAAQGVVDLHLLAFELFLWAFNFGLII